MRLLRIKSDQETDSTEVDLEVDWSLKFRNFSDAEVAANPLLNTNEPYFFMQDHMNGTFLYLIGQYQGKGSLLKFNKFAGSFEFDVSLTEESTIRSVSANKDNGDLYLCG